jgi:hypothetical protein
MPSAAFMPITTPDLAALRTEIALLGDAYSKLPDDDLFVVWFVFAFVTGNRAEAAESLTGASGEKGVDAVHIDERARLVTIVQGKYRQKLMATAEQRDHVLGFAHVAEYVAGDVAGFRNFTDGLEGAAFRKLTDARERVLERAYRLNLHYATLGRCSSSLLEEAKRLVRAVSIPALQRPRLTLLNGKQIMGVLSDYLDGVAPPVAAIELPVSSQSQSQFDESTGMTSWIISVNGGEIGQLVQQYGVKLFARNIRGYLGETAINKEIRKTLERDPASFWYLNNGVTVVCDDAVLESSGGRDRLSLRNPQIINGQQTSYALSAVPKGADKAHVTVRVISIAQDGKSEDWATYDQMVGRIVQATNSQNRIKAADLRSNDRIQVSLERDLHQLGYHYQRKRAATSEVAALIRQHEWRVRKEDLAKAVIGCENANYATRGVDILFEDPIYGRIFKHPPRHLLCRWWLARATDSEAWGTGQRQPAKWVVLQFLWDELSSDILRSQAAFIEISENRGDDARYGTLRRVVDRAFELALAFYRAERGTGAGRLEALPFFKRQDAAEGLLVYAHSGSSGHHTRYANAGSQLRLALAK